MCATHTRQYKPIKQNHFTKLASFHHEWILFADIFKKYFKLIFVLKWSGIKYVFYNQLDLIFTP